MMEKTWVGLGCGMIGRKSACAKVHPPNPGLRIQALLEALSACQTICPGLQLQLQLRFKLQPTPSVCQLKIPYGAPCHHD